MPLRPPTRRERAESVYTLVKQLQEEEGDDAAVEALVGAFLATEIRAYRAAHHPQPIDATLEEP